MKIKEISENKVITGKVVLKRSNLFIAKKFSENTQPRYGTMAIIPKDDTETINNIQAAIESAIEECKNKYGENIDFSSLKLPLKNGDEFSDDIMCWNSYFINATSSYKPGVVDHKKETVTFADVPDGQYGRVSISFHPYNINGNIGISCRLLNVQLYKERFDHRKYVSSPQEDFE